MSLSDVYRDRYYTPGYVYILGSPSERLLKFGVTINLRQQTNRNRSQGYGGIHDWVLLYRVWVEESGRVEYTALRELKRHRAVRMYRKDGYPQRSRELVNCGFTTALDALTPLLSDVQRKQAWQSSRASEFEFDIPEPVLFDRRPPRAPIGMPEGSLFFMAIDELEVSVLTASRLSLAGIDFVGTLIRKSEVELLRTSIIGSRTVGQIKEALSQLGLHLGMEVPNWPPADLDRLAKQIAPFLRKVDDLELSVRTTNCLRNDDLFYIGELVQRSEAEMLRVPNFGRKSLNEIKEVLAQMGLHLGMEGHDWRSNDLETQSPRVQDLLQIIDELELSVRTANCLRNDKIVYIGQLVQKSEAEMLRTPNFGRKSLNEIKEVLAQMGLHLGMEIPHWSQMLADAAFEKSD
jgi:DNA-directed RNA polymerase alpha subunit